MPIAPQTRTNSPPASAQGQAGAAFSSEPDSHDDTVSISSPSEPAIPTLDSAFELADNLFPMPRCVIDARRAIANGASAPQIAALIGQDQILATAVVRLANTAAFRGNSAIRELPQAVARVGMNQLDQCLLALGVMPRGKKNPVVARLMPRLLTVAAGCRVVASYQTNIEIGTAFMTGLFVDMGQVLLAHGWPQEYGAIVFGGSTAQTPSGDVIEEELDWVGFSHTDLGVRLATDWQLADDVVEGIRYSHDLIGAMSDGGPLATVMASITGLAARIARAIHGEIDESQLEPEMIIASNENVVLGLSVDAIDDLIEEIRIESFALGAVFHTA